MNSTFSTFSSSRISAAQASESFEPFTYSVLRAWRTLMLAVLRQARPRVTAWATSSISASSCLSIFDSSQAG